MFRLDLRRWTAARALISGCVFYSRRREGSTTTPPVPAVCAATRCSPRGRRCTSQVSRSDPLGGVPLRLWLERRQSLLPSQGCLCCWLVLNTAINSPLSGWFRKVAGVANAKWHVICLPSLCASPRCSAGPLPWQFSLSRLPWLCLEVGGWAPSGQGVREQEDDGVADCLHHHSTYRRLPLPPLPPHLRASHPATAWSPLSGRTKRNVREWRVAKKLIRAAFPLPLPRVQPSGPGIPAPVS